MVDHLEYSEEDEHFYYNEKVDVICPKNGRVRDAQIISIRGSFLVVRYTDSNEEEQFSLEDNLVLKRWLPGREFLKFNRIDVKNPNSNKWHEGIIIAVEQNKILVWYQDHEQKIVEEWLVKDSKCIAPVGRYTGKQNFFFETSDEINSYLYKKKKFFKATEQQERDFREEMRNNNFKIRDIKGDGNCMYRAVADQVYGNENAYDIVKSKCMDYLELERRFFSQFIDGGNEIFDQYILMKRKDGVWGDDIELQALSEIYNRPIALYSHSKEPLKTFHETASSSSRGTFDSNQTIGPIRLSYHGRAHYNSLIPIENYEDFKKWLLKTKPGEFEDTVLEQVKLKKLQVETSKKTASDQTSTVSIENEGIENSKEIELAREQFKEKKSQDLDAILCAQLSYIHEVSASDNIKKDTDVNQDPTAINLVNTIKQSEIDTTEQELINSIKKISLDESKAMNQSEDIDYFSIPSIREALELGFGLDEAVMAYSAYGDNTDLMLQYLYSMDR